ncbi:MAG: hypothetical protein ACLU0Y_03390 [Hominilimicola sp.]
MHIKKAAEIYAKPSPKYIRPDKDTLASCKYYRKISCGNKLFIDTNEKCKSIIVLDGQGSLTLGDTVIELNKGDSIHTGSRVNVPLTEILNLYYHMYKGDL